MGRNDRLHQFIRDFVKNQSHPVTTRMIYTHFSDNYPWSGSIYMSINRMGQLLHANKWVEIYNRGGRSDATTWKIKGTPRENYSGNSQKP